MTARHYDPTIGRFIQADIVVQDPYDPQTLNRYSYCRNNPIIYTDPSGHFFWIAVAVGAALGGAMSAVTGGNIWMGMLMGAISGAAFFAAGEVIAVANAELAAAAGGGGATAMNAAGGAAIHAFTGAMTGGINASISGGNGGMGMLTGGLSAGIAEYGGGFLSKDFGAQFAGRSLIGGMTGEITAEMYGGDFGQGFTQGAGTAAAGFLFNHCVHGDNFFVAVKEWLSDMWASVSNSAKESVTVKMTRTVLLHDKSYNVTTGAISKGHSSSLIGLSVDLTFGKEGNIELGGAGGKYAAGVNFEGARPVGVSYHYGISLPPSIFYFSSPK